MSRNEMAVVDGDNVSQHENCCKEEMESGESRHIQEERMEKDGLVNDTQRELSDATKLKLESKLHHIKLDMKRVLKKVRTSEIQKILKKLKFFREKLHVIAEGHDSILPSELLVARKANISKLEADFEVLKELNLDTVTEVIFNAFYISLSLTTDIKVDVQEVRVVPQHEKMVARLKNSGSIATSLTAYNNDIQSIITGKKKLSASKKKDSIKEKRKNADSDEKRGEQPLKKQKKSTLQFKHEENHEPKDRQLKSSFVTLNSGNDDVASDVSYSDYSDSEKIVPTKKNRPGQRQRREQWEKMYGVRAKHIKNAAASAPVSNVKTDKNSHKISAMVPRIQEYSTIKKKDGSLHPSWEAKKSQAIAPFQGKKVLFE